MSKSIPLLLPLMKSFAAWSEQSYPIFFLKTVFFIILAFVLGHGIDFVINRLVDADKKTPLAVSAMFQICLNIMVIFTFFKLAPGMAGEFQKTYAGLFFVALFFNSQTSFVPRLNALVPIGL